MTETEHTLTVILPSYGETHCLEELLPSINEVLNGQGISCKVIIVNDLGYSDNELEKVARLHDAEVIVTPHNMGSQQAILYGIRYQVKKYRCTHIVTMDADGQDDPSVIPRMLIENNQENIVVAQRYGKRVEGILFSLFYWLYKRLFCILTGVTPDFGNYALYTQQVADLISTSKKFTISYSLALPCIRKLKRIPVKRHARMSGRSRVGISGLFSHAVRSAVPYLNTISMRIAAFSSVIALLGFLLIVVVSFLRFFFPRYTFPNWATTIAFGSVIISIQLFTICFVMFVTAIITEQLSALRHKE